MELLGYASDDETPSSSFEPEKVVLSSSYSNHRSNLTNISELVSYSTAPITIAPLGMSLIPFNSENMPLASLPGEITGPENPYKQLFGTRKMNTEAAAIDNYTFDEQYQTYQRSGYAFDTSSSVILGDYNAYVAESLPTVQKRKRQKGNKFDGIVVDGEEDGPWVAIEKPIEAPPVIPLATTAIISAKKLLDNTAPAYDGTTPSIGGLGLNQSGSRQYIIEPEEEDEKWERINERKAVFTLPPRPPRGSFANAATTTFHGNSEKDFQGKPWTATPAGLRPVDADHSCYIPKKCVKKFLGHTKGVQCVEFIPGTGHLLLSASLDGKCKIWDVYGDRSVKRTYVGHTEAIRSACFNEKGDQFLSTAFDRYIRLWDVETGQAKATFSNRKVSYQVKFHPHDSNVFLAPSHDNKIYQWDIRTGNICQTYNYHLQSANAVVFFDDGKKFMSSSDDKKLLVWEYDIPVPIAYIQDPEMFSMPYLALHPSGNFLAGQSMDNSIPIYTCTENGVKQARKRVFKGHNNTGYACQINFSPNGKTMMSGDGLGKLCFWDWKTMMMARKFQAHENGPCIGAQWHPVHPSWVVTCGWDGMIKLWE